GQVPRPRRGRARDRGGRRSRAGLAPPPRRGRQRAARRPPLRDDDLLRHGEPRPVPRRHGARREPPQAAREGVLRPAPRAHRDRDRSAPAGAIPAGPVARAEAPRGRRHAQAADRDPQARRARVLRRRPDQRADGGDPGAGARAGRTGRARRGRRAVRQLRRAARRGLPGQLPAHGVAGRRRLAARDDRYAAGVLRAAGRSVAARLGARAAHARGADRERAAPRDRGQEPRRSAGLAARAPGRPRDRRAVQQVRGRLARDPRDMTGRRRLRAAARWLLTLAIAAYAVTDWGDPDREARPAEPSDEAGPATALRITAISDADVSPGDAIIVSFTGAEPEPPVTARLAGHGAEVLVREPGSIVVRIPGDADAGRAGLRVVQGNRRSKAWDLHVRATNTRKLIGRLVGGLALFVYGLTLLARGARGLAGEGIR